MRLVCIGLLMTMLCVILAVSVGASGDLWFEGDDEVYPNQMLEIELVIGRTDVTKITFDLDYDAENVDMQAWWVADTQSWNGYLDRDGYVCERLVPGVSGEETVFRVRLKIHNVEPGTEVWFRMKNVVLWENDQPIPMEDVLWKRSVQKVPSSDNCLADLRLSDCAISPGFSPTQLEYTATVSHQVGQVTVTAEPRDTGASVTIDSPPLEYGKATDVTVTVTAEDGSVRVYTIAVTREDAPDRLPSDNCDLQSLEVTDYKLSPVFSPEITEYVLWLPYETTGVDITALAADTRATVTISGNKGFKAGQDNLIDVICTAEDGTQKHYIIIAKRAQMHIPTAPAQEELGAEVNVDSDGIPGWAYAVVAVVSAAGLAGVGILISKRK